MFIAKFHALLQALGAGGIFLYPLLATGFLGLASIIDRAYVFVRLASLPSRLADLLREPPRDLGPIRQALAGIGAHNGYVRFLKPILDHDGHPLWWIESRAADRAAQIERQLDQGLWILETVVTAAPLLGLLGTIAGMIGAFRLFGESGAVDPGAVTGGVAEALVSTALGIGIALLALAAFNFFSHRRAVLLDEMEMLGTRLIDRIRLDRGEAS